MTFKKESISEVHASIANPIHDAVGIRFNQLPITPEKVLEALWKK
jgi:CO/xanthine dehydrogenase Mo-binding subunit